MTVTARRSRTLATGVAAAVVGVLGLSATPAAAQPSQPLPPQPSPSVVSQSAATAGTALTPAVPNAALAAPTTADTTLTAPQAATAATAPAAAAQGGISTPQVAAPAVVPITPATSGTLTDFFHEKGVTLEPQNSADFKALNIVLPMPRGWAHIPDPNVADAFVVIADRVGGNGLYSSNAQVVVYKLIGEFDPREAISHGFVDAQQLPAWRTTGGSMGEVGGMPMSTIEGTYRENNMTLNTSRRHIIATAGPDKYLVSLAVTTSVDQVVAAAEATDAIVRGFKVNVPGATPPATAPAAPQATPQVPQATHGQHTPTGQPATVAPSALNTAVQSTNGLSG
ncbi:hypothetical protein BST36_11550 [Mycolicibacterium moriokaense]|uniref:Lipoprotein LpqN n=1 Tax=Mycolicibacterium moriokaense TaxID=39691 RepID=A0AAD1M4N6_9MYCO|nr:LpqN/LpqT family lipoprotein [Mycolicibacterium moriokaense]MCV7037569.1 LpqN/LpqT family lipoprotein [Mycolicibacterium moriokaense]ORB23758.1 hypothetical protein BST36_11550 [Mycolicibacterium moriokaense]BBW99493.1 hypothetical protein MMOR_04300 [Mycolicibacterium moriokaense]